MNYILLSEKRTGSTFLETALNSHPEILSLDELFILTPRDIVPKIEFFRTRLERVGYKNFENTMEGYIGEVFSLSKSQKIIFRLNYSQIEDWSRGVDIAYILREKFGCGVIHLRRDYIRTLISMKVKNLYRRKMHREDVGKITLDPKETLEEVYELKRRFYRFNDMFGNKKLYLKFEDILEVKKEEETRNVKFYGDYNHISKEKTFLNEKSNKEICDFLGVKNIPMYSYITRFVDNIWNYVENREELTVFMKSQNILI